MTVLRGERSPEGLLPMSSPPTGGPALHAGQPFGVQGGGFVGAGLGGQGFVAIAGLLSIKKECDSVVSAYSRILIHQ